jgi:hypothetical protein
MSDDRYTGRIRLDELRDGSPSRDWPDDDGGDDTRPSDDDDREPRAIDSYVLADKLRQRADNLTPTGRYDHGRVDALRDVADELDGGEA